MTDRTTDWGFHVFNGSRDDHPQYARTDGSRAFTGNVVVNGTLTVGGAQVLPPGMLMDYAAAAAPTGWLACDGSAVSRTTYANLFAAIGVTWGAGDGSTTFNLPDLRGRTTLGSGTGAGLTARTLAAKGGAETNDHTHPLSANGFANIRGSGTQIVAAQAARSAYVANYSLTGSSSGTGGSGITSGVTLGGATDTTTSFSVLNPFAVTTKIIKT